MNREEIIGVRDYKIEEIDVPQWGGSVHIRSMSTGDRIDFVDYFSENDAEINLAAWVATRCICDSSGQRIFTDDDLESIKKKNPEAILLIGSKVTDLSGLSGSSYEEEVKN